MPDPTLRRRTQAKLPNHRWKIYPQFPQLAEELAQAISPDFSPVLAQVLIDRGMTTVEAAQGFIHPDSLDLPSPLDDFPALDESINLLIHAIATNKKIAICGDYDADGMTSTALLLRALRYLGANVDYAIPSRMKDGYGINERIVEEFHREGVKLILTVDNGIAAFKPIVLARNLGLDVIVTDHHEVPPEVPPATTILNPKLIREDSPYRGVAGVGVAYILAVCLAQKLKKAQPLINPLRELLTLGTIADLAPLTGVNRRWLKWGLRQLPNSKLAGVQALIQVSGATSSASKQGRAMKPDEIGFRLGPRINAVGRIGDPQIVIELLTTDDRGVALERAMQCEQINARRQEMCEEIEREAIAWVESSNIDLGDRRVLLVVKSGWHHGVIGIVASRLVERYGVPVFIGTYEDAEKTHVRGSARGIPEFDVFEALQFCDDLLGKYGGHRAAGGFSLSGDNLQAFGDRLSQFACHCLDPSHLKPAIAIDTALDFDRINLQFYREIDALHPCGIENPAPVFWTGNAKVVEQRIVGKGHLKLTLETDGSPANRIQAIAWRWGEYYPLPPRVDVAYKLRENVWNGETSIELELVSARFPEVAPPTTTPAPPAQPILVNPEAPPVSARPEWLAGPPLEDLFGQLQGRVFVYGDGRPSAGPTHAAIDYDRPQGVCETFIFWTLPPSLTHLKWFLAKGQPQQIYIYSQLPSLPSPEKLRSLLSEYLTRSPGSPLHLLKFSQAHWVAPSTVLAALRELGYPCKDFPKTDSLVRELERLHRWYGFSPAKLGKIRF
ncbi:MAG: single-stranded-DNA-specific exonuclease RecJ [Cyanobacteria bacterium J007]|nr:MAG: single-stranded-DNA-specific exonuclease RecJ [Cyanobacteria bacterium J007]